MARKQIESGLREAAERLRRVRLRLLDPSPGHSEELALDLDRVAALLKPLAESAELAGLAPDAGLLAAALDVDQQLKITGALVGQAQAFHAWWLRTAGLAAGGYTASGEPRELEPSPRLYLDA
jgi:hypothetical protein